MLKSNIEKCVDNDTRFWIGNRIIENADDYNKTIKIITDEFKTLGELHHILSAQFEIFPLLRAKHLPVILSELMNVVT